MHMSHLEILVRLQILIQEPWGGAQDSAFLSSSQVTAYASGLRDHVLCSCAF